MPSVDLGVDGAYAAYAVAFLVMGLGWGLCVYERRSEARAMSDE